MKTLSYYKQLRESYACIIPKTAPAYELIEALDALIASLQPKEDEQPYFLGVPVNLPKGWRIVNHTSGNVYVTLHSDTRQIGHIWTVNDRYMVSYRAATVGDYDSLQSAIKRLINEATQDYSIFNYYGQEFRIPKGWCMARDDNGDYTLVDASHVAFGKVRRTTEGHAWAYVDRDPGDAQYTDSIRAALRGLIDRAWGSVDAAS